MSDHDVLALLRAQETGEAAAAAFIDLIKKVLDTNDTLSVSNVRLTATRTGTTGDQKLLQDLQRVDEGVHDVSDWEADFIESMMNLLEGGVPHLTDKQRKCVIKILDKYDA